MFLTNVYDSNINNNNSYNMMLNNNIINCFEEKQIDQSILTDIINIDKYILSVSYRNDGSSKFGKDNKWAAFSCVKLYFASSALEILRVYFDF